MTTKTSEVLTVELPKLRTKTIIGLARCIHEDLLERHAYLPAWREKIIYRIPAGSIRATDPHAEIWIHGIGKNSFVAISQMEDKGRVIRKDSLEDFERTYHHTIDEMRGVIGNELELRRSKAESHQHAS